MRRIPLEIPRDASTPHAWLLRRMDGPIALALTALSFPPLQGGLGRQLVDINDQS